MKGASRFVLRASAIGVAAVFLSATATVRPCAAQHDPRLVAAVRQAQEGQGDSARAAVKRILDATPVADPLYAEALYTSGVVAASTADRERQFQRLVVEHNGSAWADDALLSLAQLNFARGDLAGVTRNAERLASDYPESDLIAEAAKWAARAYFRQQNTEAGCRWLTNGLAHTDSLDVELKNDLDFLNGRCVAAGDTAAGRRIGGSADTTTRPASQPPRTADSTPPSANPPVRPSAAPSAFTVQVASSSTQANADALIARLTKDGFRGGYTVTDGSAIKVRIGRFTARADADALAGRMRTKYPSVFVVGVMP